MAHIIWIIVIIGALIALWGISAVLKPDWMKRFITFTAAGNRWRLAAAAKVVVGVVFLILATSSRIPWVLIVVGFLTAGGSIIALTLKPEKMQAMMHWCQQRPLWMYRLWGVVAVLFGALIIYAGWPK